MDDSVVFWILAVVGVLLTGISKSGFAGGAGVITVPLLALVISPVTAAAIMLPLLLVMDYLSVMAWRGKQRNDILLLVVPSAVVGISLGYFLFNSLNDELIKLSLGILSLFFALWGLLNGLSTASFSSNFVGRIAGCVAGFTSFVSHAGGPPLNFYLIPKKLPREQYLATAVFFFATINVIKLVPYALLGQFNFENLSIGLVLMPVAWVGVKLGLLIQKKLNDKVFYRIILIMLFILGIKLIIDGL